MAYNPKDHYFKKAKEEGFAARSVYKLEEIDKKWRLFRAGQRVLDLGCSPGSWSQYAAEKILNTNTNITTSKSNTNPKTDPKKGTLLGLDLNPVTVSISNAEFREQDINDFIKDFTESGADREFDVVLSDMAPKTTGIKVTDQARSLELCQLALFTARHVLKTGGSFVCKIFQSSDTEPFRKEVERSFKNVYVFKPKSTRTESKEIFIVGKGFKVPEILPLTWA